MAFVRALLLCATAVLWLTGCSGGGSGTGGDAGAGGTAGSGGTRGPDLCEGVSCDDGDACTADQCNEADGSCVHEPTLNAACRTRIDIDSPARGATLEGIGESATVAVTGEVSSGLGEITSFTINGETVPLGADGRFSHEVAASVGGNTLVLEAEDDAGNARRRVQSFLWSTGYREPVTPKEGISPQGLGIWLAQASLDDGGAPPPTDFADILELVLESLDLDSLFDSNSAIASSAGYDIYITSLDLGSTSVALTAGGGVLGLQATLTDISGDLVFDCTEFGCQLLGGDSTGGYSIDSVEVTADAILQVEPDNTIAVSLNNVQSNVTGLDVSSDNGFTNFLLSIIEPFIRDSLVADLESTVSNSLSSEVGPLLESGLAELAFSFTLDVPSLAGADPIPVDVLSDFESVDFIASPQGGTIIERAGAYPRATTTPYTNLGVPNRDRCGAGGQAIAFPRAEPVEIGLSDDLLNQVLYAAWRSGWLELEDASELVGDPVALAVLGITNLELGISGWLAPTVSDCNDDGMLRAHVGDIEISGSMDRDGRPLTFTAYATLTGTVALEAVEGGLGIGISSIDQADVEVTIEEDDQLDAEPLLQGVIANALSSTVENALGGGGLGTLPIPEVDLSSALGVPPGTAVLRVSPQSLSRADGVTVIGGAFE